MARRAPETLQEWLERYEQRADKAYMNYQSTGDPKYDRQYYEYDTIAECIRAKMRERQVLQLEREKRTRNCNAQCDRLLKPEYSRSEVFIMLHDAIYW